MAKSVKKRKRSDEGTSSPIDRGRDALATPGRSAFSGWPVIIGWLAMLIFTVHACTHMVAAGDTWVAMACGRHFVNHGVDTVEPFSANSHSAGPTEAEIKDWPGWARWITDKVGIETVKRWHPTGWVNQNWLTHVIFYSLIPKSSYADGVSFTSNTLVYWKFAIYIVTVVCVYYTGRLLGANPALCAVFSCFAMFAGRSFLDIRPAGFSNMLVAVFLLVLVLATYRNILLIWLVVPVTVFWCNVHGGYIYVFIMLVPFFALHLLTVLPRKWTVSVGSIVLWVGLYTLAYKFRAGLDAKIVEFSSMYSFAPAPPHADKLFYLIAILGIVSIVIAAQKRIERAAFYSYHIVVSVILLLALLIARFFPEIPTSLPGQQREALVGYVTGNQMTFLAAFVVLTALIVITGFLKDRLTSIRLTGICHTAGAGVAAFAASIVFNPFHLTNLTHTLAISMSRHAARWRDIHEWHGAFHWSNPVGTGFPFLVLYILSIGLLILWLFSRFLMPRLLKVPRNELEAQKRSYIKLSAIFGYAATVLVCFVTFVSFSLLGLDAVSFFWCAAFVAIILLSIYKSVHFIYLTVLLTLLALWSGSEATGYHGRYFYPFVILPVYVILHALASLFSKPTKYKPVNIAFVTLTALVSLVLMTAIFNPFKFDQSLWHVKQFFALQRVWRPVYDRNEGLSYKNLFDMLYMLNVVWIIFWLGYPYFKEVFGRKRDEENQKQQTEVYQLPRIDLAVITIAALTIYMAIRSRRFIPIAGIAACPIVAMLIDQIVRAVSASRNFYANRRLTVSPMPRSLELSFIAAGILAVLFFSTWWGLKFKHIYLDAWPNDPKLSSVFMRMTASDAKPFYVMKFIKDNKLEGNMFNYWTEGGFIAWGQEPDPNTGKTPLQLFMDGRAQAAYDRDTFDDWSYIMAGGHVTHQILGRVKARREKITADDYKLIGNWMDEQLKAKENDAWVVLMPAVVFGGSRDKGSYHAIRALERHLDSDWRLVFLNNRQKLLVDITTPQGKKLFDGIFTGETVYPDEYHRSLIRSHSWYLYRSGLAEKREGFEYAKKAFELSPSPTPLFEVLGYGVFPQLKPEVDEFCKSYLEEFEANRQTWSGQDGYRLKTQAVQLVCAHLKDPARQQEYLGELKRIAGSKRW